MVHIYHHHLLLHQIQQIQLRQYEKRIETFAKNIDETGKFLFQVKLPLFDIDDSLRVESRFGDVTRCTSATWQNGVEISSPLLPNELIEEKESITHVQSTETDVPLNNNNNDVTNDEIEEVPDKIDEQVSQKKKEFNFNLFMFSFYLGT